MSSASSAVTYTSVYTDFERRRFYEGSDEKPTKVDSQRVIVYGYDGIPMHPTAPPSPDYMPGPEHPPSLDYMPSLEHLLSPVYDKDLEDPEEDHTDYPSNGGDGDDDPSDDDDDDDDDTDDEEI
nr:hypothetical protein [Tanacetum cinerariifolium]